MSRFFNLIIGIQLVFISTPLQAANQCVQFTRGLFAEIEPSISIGGRYYKNKSLPWLIQYTGHNPDKLTKGQVIEELNFTVSIPLNILGENTATFDDYFLQLKYRYGNVPTPEGVINNNNVSYLTEVQILDYFGRPRINNHREALDRAFNEIKSASRTQVRKREPQFINLKLNEELEVPIIPYFRQSTVDDYISFMSKYFFTSQFELLRTVKNRWIGVQNFARGVFKKPKLNKITRTDQSTLTQITTFRQYEIRRKKLALDKFKAILLDRTVYTMIGYILIPLGIGSAILIKFGENRLNMTIPALGEEEVQKSRDEVQKILEDKIKELDINKAFKDLLKEDAEFRRAVEQSGISKDTLFEIQVEAQKKNEASKYLEIELKSRTKNGDSIVTKEKVEFIPN